LRCDYITAALLSTEVDKLLAGTYYFGVVKQGINLPASNPGES